MADHWRCSVDELSERLSPQEFIEWIAFDQLSPIGGERLDYLAAMVCSVLCNLWSKKKFKPNDFLPQWGKEKKKRGSTPQEIMAWARSLQAQQERMKR